MTFLGFDKRDLKMTINLCKMMLRDRYLGSALGGVWAVLNPIILLGVFTFIFGFVFKSKIPGADTTLSYAMWMIAGYGPWIALTESVMAGTTSVVGGAPMIKNLSFKAECLPLAATLTGCVPLVVSQFFLACLLLADDRVFTWHLATVPLIIFLQFSLLAGVSLFLSSINVFLRDVSLVMPNVLVILLFTSPIFFPIDVFPEQIRAFVGYSPLAILADGYRQPFIYNASIDFSHMLVLVISSFFLIFSGLAFFRRLKFHFDSRL